MIRPIYIFFLSYFICNQALANELHFHWEDSFSSVEKIKLEKWLQEVNKANTAVLGEFPFDIHFHIFSSNSNRPVAFGSATRKETSQVKLYVNANYSLPDLLADWTAPHEISHLSIPFIGKKSKWFSEGYATYLSRKTMEELGIYSNSQVDSIYLKRIGDTKKYYQSSTQNFIQVSDSLMRNHQYNALYWGSASYFYRADKQLEKEGKISLTQVIKRYQTCCRSKNESLLEIIKSFNRISESEIFTELMIQYRTLPARIIMRNF